MEECSIPSVNLGIKPSEGLMPPYPQTRSSTSESCCVRSSALPRHHCLIVGLPFVEGNNGCLIEGFCAGGWCVCAFLCVGGGVGSNSLYVFAQLPTARKTVSVTIFIQKQENPPMKDLCDRSRSAEICPRLREPPQSGSRIHIS